VNEVGKVKVCVTDIGTGPMGHVPPHFDDLLGTGGHREQKNDIRSTAFGDLF